MLKVLILVSITVGAAYGQVYPRWFLFQEEVKCTPNAVTVSQPSTFQRDTAIANGFLDGCIKIAKYASLSISGGQAFWQTEGGTFAMGSNYSEVFDTSMASRLRSTEKVLNSFADRKKILVLVGGTSCSYDNALSERIYVGKVDKPGWVETIPDKKGYIYGVGESEEYYYESSSWNKAEKNAYMAVARSFHVKVKGLEKQTSTEHQDIRTEDMSVHLNGIEIIARWRDLKNKIFYVLARVKI